MPKKTPTKRQVKRAIHFFEDEISARANVVGIGIVQERDVDRKSRERDHLIAVYVTQKVPLDDLSEEDRVPPYFEIKVRGGMLKVRTAIIEGELSSFESDAINSEDSIGIEPL